ncbi:MAG TPA: hypothetical protein VFT59_00670 [Candidatus Saccharimonadales bacterium]|nr:hypothetical protein [Candidatus Saccharimonadales bacterium]
MRMSSMKLEQDGSHFIFRSSVASDCEVVIKLVHQFLPDRQSELKPQYDQERDLPWSVTVDEPALRIPLIEWIRDRYASDTGWLWMRSEDGLFISIAGRLVYRP